MNSRNERSGIGFGLLGLLMILVGIALLGNGCATGGAKPGVVSMEINLLKLNIPWRSSLAESVIRDADARNAVEGGLKAEVNAEIPIDVPE